MRSIEMSVPLWGLCVFIIWTMAIAILLIAVRLRHLQQGGSVTDFGDPTGNKLLWRVFRSQANCVENLPLYAGVVLLLEVREIGNGAIDALVAIYIGFRLLHSLIHIFGFNPNFRVACLGVQFACLLGLMGLAIAL
ncbi:MAG: MAPEG family protein [Cyanobacteria bacterium P01_E01_bin.42]